MKKLDIKSMIKSVGLNFLTFAPVFVALLILFIALPLLSNTIMAGVSFIAGLSGVIIVIRREIPLPTGNVEGKSAIVQGYGIIIFFWAAAIINLIAPN